LKKIAGFTSLLFMLVASGVYAQSVDLDTGIKNGAEHFEKTLQSGTTIAVLGVRSDFSQLSEYVIDQLSYYLVNGRIFTVVDRNYLDVIQRELIYQMSGDVSDETAQSIGKQIGAQTVITVGIQPFGNEYRLVLRALSVETGVLQAILSQNIKAGDNILAGSGFVAPAPESKTRRDNIELGAGFAYLFHNAAISGIGQKKEISAFALNISAATYFWDTIGLGSSLNVFFPQSLKVTVMDRYITYKGSEFNHFFGMDMIIGSVFIAYQRDKFTLPVSAGVHFLGFFYEVYTLGYSAFSFGLGTNASGEYHLNKNLYFLARLQLSLDFCSIAIDSDVADNWQTSWQPSLGINPSIGIGFQF